MAATIHHMQVRTALDPIRKPKDERKNNGAKYEYERSERKN